MKAESQQKKRKKEKIDYPRIKRNKTKLGKHKESKYEKLYQLLLQKGKNAPLNVK